MTTTDKIKKYCTIHHFYHSSEECPFCSSERIQTLSRKFSKKNDEKQKKETSKKNKEKEITQSDLEKLMRKFNTK